MKTVLLILSVLIVAGSSGAAQNTRFPDATRSTRTPAQNPRLADALRSARAGDVRAQYMVGMMYLFGQDGARQDIAEGARWLQQSAQGGLPQSMVNLASLYDVGQGVPLDPARASQLRRQAAQAGDPTAKGQLADDRRMPGQAEFRRASVLNDLLKPELAVPIAYKAASAGSGNAALLLGRAYQFGIGVPVDLSMAVRWYKVAADRGQEDGQRHLAYMYEFGLGVKADRKTALVYYDKSAAQGDKLAMQAASNLRSPDYDRPRTYHQMNGNSSSTCGESYTAQNGYCLPMYPGLPVKTQ